MKKSQRWSTSWKRWTGSRGCKVYLCSSRSWSPWNALISLYWQGFCSLHKKESAVRSSGSGTFPITFMISVFFVLTLLSPAFISMVLKCFSISAEDGGAVEAFIRKSVWSRRYKGGDPVWLMFHLHPKSWCRTCAAAAANVRPRSCRPCMFAPVNTECHFEVWKSENSICMDVRTHNFPSVWRWWVFRKCVWGERSSASPPR